jgi:hypothetical protein
VLALVSLLALANAGRAAAGPALITVEPGDRMAVAGSDIQCGVPTGEAPTIACYTGSGHTPLAGSYAVAVSDKETLIFDATGAQSIVAHESNPSVSGALIKGSTRKPTTFVIANGEDVLVAGSHVACAAVRVDGGTVQAFSCGVIVGASLTPSTYFASGTYAASISGQDAGITRTGANGSGTLVALEHQPSSTATAPSGNAAAIKLFEQSQSAIAGYEGVSFAGGDAAYKIITEPGYDSFGLDLGQTSAGMRRASDAVVVVQHSGLVAEEIDTLSAAGLPSVRIWQTGAETAVGEVMDAHPCTTSFADANHFVVVGEPFIGASLSGYHFAGVTKAGAGETVQFTEPSGGGTVDGALTLDAATDLWQSLTLQLHGGASNGLSLSEEHFSYRRIQPSQQPPAQLKPCP